MTKYNSKKVTIDGIQFDSKSEGDYYLYLSEQLQDGLIKSFSLQPKIELIPKFEKYGKKFRSTTYTPDFKVTDWEDNVTYIDVKGFSTAPSELRKKLFDYLFPNDKLVWLSYVKKYGGWIEIDELKRLRKESKK